MNINLIEEDKLKFFSNKDWKYQKQLKASTFSWAQIKKNDKLLHQKCVLMIFLINKNHLLNTRISSFNLEKTKED